MPLSDRRQQPPRDASPGRGSGTTYYYAHDALGSTRALTDATGVVVPTDPYAPSGTLTASSGSVPNPFRLAVPYQDSQTGFYYLRARCDNPTTGQFLSVDPLATVTQAPYSYAAGDPVTVGDPSGEWPGFCKDNTDPLVTCIAWSAKYQSWTRAEQWVRKTLPGEVTYLRTTCGRRFPDVYNLELRRMIEVKTGSPTASGFNLSQVAKDRSVLSAGGADTSRRRGGGFLPVGVLQWYVMPNADGVTAPAQRLLDALHAAKIPVFIFLDDAGSSVPCDRLPEICRVPLDSPPDA